MTPQELAAALEVAFQQAREMDASLDERLAFVARVVRSLSPPFAEAVDRFVARLRQADAGASAPRPGEPMPPFLLPDEAGRLVGLDTLLGTGPAAIVFNRGHWCPYCRLNTVALAEAQRQVRAEGGQIVAIMPEGQRFAGRFKAEAAADFPILTDLDNGYALSLDLAIWVGEEMRALIAAAGWDLPAYQGNETWMLPIPATFVVGSDGLVTARFVDPDYRKRMAVEDLLAALREAGARAAGEASPRAGEAAASGPAAGPRR
jgi:peroxiredoxin